MTCKKGNEHDSTYHQYKIAYCDDEASFGIYLVSIVNFDVSPCFPPN